MALNRSTGWIILAVGIVALLITFFASDLGLGGTQYGIKHIILLIVGIVLAGIGLYAALRPVPTGTK
jgi:hypothetical protein